ncbi:uncharacterized protein [Prorops nasuta]|uniref:uncharacterized protein n=1 Tax=Prorops nasuta TaxID=863751 RepID=UPI0034D01556
MSYLRNSKGANKPFCSPFKKSFETDNTRLRVTKRPRSPNSLQSLASCRSTSPIKKVQKRLHLLNRKEDSSKYSINLDSNSRDYKERIETKKKEILDLKKNISKQREKAENLKRLIDMWRNGCQQALQKYLYELQQKRNESINMIKLLQSLNIPEDLVKYTENDDSFN